LHDNVPTMTHTKESIHNLSNLALSKLLESPSSANEAILLQAKELALDRGLSESSRKDLIVQLEDLISKVEGSLKHGGSEDEQVAFLIDCGQQKEDAIRMVHEAKESIKEKEKPVKEKEEGGSSAGSWIGGLFIAFIIIKWILRAVAD